MSRTQIQIQIKVEEVSATEPAVEEQQAAVEEILVVEQEEEEAEMTPAVDEKAAEVAKEIESMPIADVATVCVNSFLSNFNLKLNCRTRRQAKTKAPLKPSPLNSSILYKLKTKKLLPLSETPN